MCLVHSKLLSIQVNIFVALPVLELPLTTNSLCRIWLAAIDAVIATTTAGSELPSFGAKVALLNFWLSLNFQSGAFLNPMFIVCIISGRSKVFLAIAVSLYFKKNVGLFNSDFSTIWHFLMVRRLIWRFLDKKWLFWNQNNWQHCSWLRCYYTVATAEAAAFLSSEQSSSVLHRQSEPNSWKYKNEITK